MQRHLSCLASPPRFCRKSCNCWVNGSVLTCGLLQRLQSAALR